MTGGFQRRRRGGVVATFSAVEGDLLRSLASQLVELLRSESPVAEADKDPLEAMLGMDGPTSEPEDPVLARLLPPAYREDDDAAADFRRFTEGQLRDGKAGNAQTVVEDLREAGLPDTVSDVDLTLDLELDGPSAMSWLKALADMRLALATRLDVTDDDQDYWDALPDEDPRVAVHDIYEWLGFLQETLVQAVSR